MNDTSPYSIQPRAGVVELETGLLEPFGMREISAREEVYALDLRVPGEAVEIEVTTRGVSVPRVDVQVCDIAHGEIVLHTLSTTVRQGS